MKTINVPNDLGHYTVESELGGYFVTFHRADTGARRIIGHVSDLRSATVVAIAHAFPPPLEGQE